MFPTKVVGVHRHALTAFELALRDADIEQQNLVYVSSILPPRCQVITREPARWSPRSAMRTNRPWNGAVVNLGEFALTDCQPRSR